MNTSNMKIEKTCLVVVAVVMWLKSGSIYYGLFFVQFWFRSNVIEIRDLNTNLLKELNCHLKDLCLFYWKIQKMITNVIAIRLILHLNWNYYNVRIYEPNSFYHSLNNHEWSFKTGKINEKNNGQKCCFRDRRLFLVKFVHHIMKCNSINVLSLENGYQIAS